MYEGRISGQGSDTGHYVGCTDILLRHKWEVTGQLGK